MWKIEKKRSRSCSKKGHDFFFKVDQRSNWKIFFSILLNFWDFVCFFEKDLDHYFDHDLFQKKDRPMIESLNHLVTLLKIIQVQALYNILNENSGLMIL